MDQNVLNKQRDSWCESFHEGCESDLFNSVIDMERNSEWIPAISSKDIRLESIDDRPIFFSEQMHMRHMDDVLDLAEETAQIGVGTQLLIYTSGKVYSNGRCHELVRDTAMSGIYRVAKLYGSALSRMSKPLFAETINNAFSVARGSALALIRYGKLSGLHSGSDGGYLVLPISKLLDISKDTLTKRFGYSNLIYGFNTHGFTRARWELPDAQDRLVEMYQQAIQRSGNTSKYATNFMPGIDFCSSDTAASCASLDPVFFKPGSDVPMRFVKGVHIKHLKRGEARNKDGLELFQEGVDGIFAKFEETVNIIADLSTKEIYHPGNCCINLCNKFGISPKYGQAALEEVQRIAAGEMFISAHDLYIGMTEILAEADRNDASPNIVTDLEEALVKITRADFSKFDVGGTVAWGNNNTD